MIHAIRMVGHVRMRTLYVRPDSSLNLPTACAGVAVSTLLRTLILEAVTVQLPYAAGKLDRHQAPTQSTGDLATSGPVQALTRFCPTCRAIASGMDHARD